VASSSSADWVVGHLQRMGLDHHFGAFATSDRLAGRTKPAPDAYLLACRDLGVDPRGAVALEDSAHGLTAALRAGLTTVAVPSAITVHTDLSAAHHIASGLGEVTLGPARRSGGGQTDVGSGLTPGARGRGRAGP
jgi:beta-phosphoglucomutase-like phosphatase (HAD superfamily)